MSTSNNDIANATTFNSSYISREIDSSTVGKLGLLQTADATEGASVTRLQRTLNSYASLIGTTTGEVFNFVFTWTNFGVGATNDTLKGKIDALITKLRDTTGNGGHSHTGVDGDGAKVGLSGLDIAGFTTGSVLYIGASAVIESAATFFFDTTNKRLGLGTNAPNTTLDLDGDLAYRKLDVATAATIAALASSKAQVRFTGATTTDLQGVANGFDGKQIQLLNKSSAVVTLKHEDAGATAADRINTVGGTDFDLDPDSVVALTYDSTSLRWYIASGAGGAGGGQLVVTGLEGSPTAITAGGGITPADVPRELIFVEGSGGDVDVTVNPQIAAGTVIGQELIIVGANDAQSLTLEDGTGLSLNGSWVGFNRDTLNLFWTGTVWAETSRR